MEAGSGSCIVWLLHPWVKQEDPLSPDLFGCVIQCVFNNCKYLGNGINVNGDKLTNLKFADDVVLIAESAIELANALGDVAGRAGEAGLEINSQKTFIMTNSTKTKISLSGSELKYAEEVTYLGQVISFHDMTNKEIKKRKELCWKGYWKLKRIFRGNFSIDQKIKILDKCIYPIITYGCQSWIFTKKCNNFLEILQRRLLRAIIKVKLKDKVTNASLMARTSSKSLLSKARKLKWNWGGGHLARLRTERWTTKLINWYPRGRKRKKGKPSMRWEHEFVNYAGPQWQRVAEERAAWANASGILFDP